MSMLSKHPFDVPLGRKLSKDEVNDALRLSIIAELDAVSLYLQLARAIEDEKIKKVFEDIAREEKTHIGEFLALLKSLDPEQVEELAKGAEEVKEIAGISIVNNEESNEKNSSNIDFEKEVVKTFKKIKSESTTISKNLPIMLLGKGVDAVPIEVLKENKIERTVLPLCEISVKFTISNRDIDYYLRTKQSIEMPSLYKAALNLARAEDELILENLLKCSGIRMPMSSWDIPGQSIMEIERVIGEFFKLGARRPIILFLSPGRYGKLITVSEKTGVTDLERMKELVDKIVVTNISDDKVLVVSATSDVIDVVYGVDSEVEYIGPEDGIQSFRAYSTLAIRVKDASRIAVLEAGSK